RCYPGSSASAYGAPCTTAPERQARAVRSGHCGELADDRHARLGELLALRAHVLLEELLVHGVLVEMMRWEHGGQHRHFGVERSLNDPMQHGLRHEVVPIDSAVDDQPAGTDR